MGFAVDAEKYDAFMGRYSDPLAVALLAEVGAGAGDRALDVGCGPGVLTRHLAARLGPDRVAAVDPSPPFVAAVRDRLPGVVVEQAAAEHLPFDDARFDLVLAQLVVPFMTDPVAGLREMGRVCRPGGLVAATAWDHADEGTSPLSPFWRVAGRLDPGTFGETQYFGTRTGEIAAALTEIGLAEVRELPLNVQVTHASFEEWWEPYTWGVGPPGDYLASLDGDGRTALRQQARAELGDGPIAITGRAWCAVGRAPSRPPADL